MPTVIVAMLYASFGGGNGRRRGETMDNEPIFTEYELSLKKARQKANRLTHDAVLDPHAMEFVTPDELKRRDAENVKRLQEISGK